MVYYQQWLIPPVRCSTELPRFQRPCHWFPAPPACSWKDCSSSGLSEKCTHRTKNMTQDSRGLIISVHTVCFAMSIVVDGFWLPELHVITFRLQVTAIQSLGLTSFRSHLVVDLRRPPHRWTIWASEQQKNRRISVQSSLQCVQVDGSGIQRDFLLMIVRLAQMPKCSISRHIVVPPLCHSNQTIRYELQWHASKSWQEAAANLLRQPHGAVDCSGLKLPCAHRRHGFNTSFQISVHCLCNGWLCHCHLNTLAVFVHRVDFLQSLEFWRF